jgi:hypothetical protein
MTIVAYLLWLMPRRRLIGRSSWQIALPSPRSTLLQIGIGIWDLGAGAIAVYALLPDYPAVDFTVLLVVFVIAILLGFVSHAPGSLGVIEATMLVGLPEFPKEELLASLLIFRFLYFIVPLSFAAVLLGLRELRVIAGSAATVGERKDRWLRKRAPSDCDRMY